MSGRPAIRQRNPGRSIEGRPVPVSALLVSCAGDSRPIGVSLVRSCHPDANLSHPPYRLAHAKHRHRPTAAQAPIGPAGMEGTYRRGFVERPAVSPGVRPGVAAHAPDHGGGGGGGTRWGTPGPPPAAFFALFQRVGTLQERPGTLQGGGS